MIKKLTITLMLVITSSLVLADESYDQLKSQVQKLEKRIDTLEKNAKQSQDSTNDLRKQLVELLLTTKIQQQTLNEISVNINLLKAKQETFTGLLEQLSYKTEQKTQTIDEIITARSNWYGVAMAILFLMLGGCYWYLRHRNDESEKSLSAQVKNTMDTLRSTEEKIAKSDTALADSLFEILKKMKVQELSGTLNGQSSKAETNHHLPLKLADEIHRMRKRLISLPEDTKGLMPLQKSLERLESELVEQGYEIIDHAGMSYTENLSVDARFVPSDDLGADQKIISKVIVPQVNYKGVMIRMANLEVSIGS